MSICQRFVFIGLACMLSLVAMRGAHADALLQTVPSPDVSKLSAEAAKQLAAQRAGIEKAKAGLVGPPLAQAYADIAALYARNGFDDVAAVALYDASQISPSDSRWLYLRGVIARRLKRNDDARANFQAALDHDKIYLPIRYRLADTLIDTGDLTGARKLLEEAARDNPKQAIAFAMLGQLALKQKRYADAVNNIGQALNLDPKADELYAHLADAYAGQGNAKAADEARAKVGKTTPTLDDPLVAGFYTAAPAAQGPASLEQVQSLARQGRIALARQQLADLLTKNPNDVDALSLSARIEASAGNQVVAQMLIDQALKIKSDSAIVHLSNGVVAEYAKDDNKAYDEYQRAQHLDAKLADANLLLGNAEMRRSRYAQAADRYRQLIVLQPDNAVAYAHLVAAQVAQGKCADAVQLINGALARRKDDGDLLQIFVRVASTCPAATAIEKDIALDYGRLLYKQVPDPSNSAALALALAAHGQFKDAQQYQAQAIFESVRARDNGAAALYRSAMQSFVKQQVPDRPWPPDHAYFKAPLLSAAPQAPAPAAPPPKS